MQNRRFQCRGLNSSLDLIEGTCPESAERLFTAKNLFTLMRPLPVLVLVLFARTTLFGQPFDPSLKWKTMETEHFSIHFHQYEKSLALEVSKISEDVYLKITEFLDWRPKGKTQIVIVDNQDLANGYANPFPINTIVLYPAQPPAEESYYEDWLRELITHEFTHIVQLDRTEGFPGFLRKIFGRIIINNAAQPIWFIEGLAVYSESRFTNGGRLNSPYFSMILNGEINSNNLKSIDRASNFPLIWPAGITPYLYGSTFVNWLIERYGEESIVEYNKHTSRGIPFAVNRAAKRTFGKDFITLWKEWQEELQYKYPPVKNIRTTPLTTDGEWNVSPSFSPDGKSVAYVHSSFNDYPGLVILDIETHSRRKIVEGYINPGISWSKDGETILFSRLDVVKDFNIYSNIYECNTANKKLTKVKLTERGRYPIYTPDGKAILFVKEHQGSNDLCIVYPEKDSLVILLHNDDHTQYHYPQFSVDGKRILLSIWKKVEGVQIYIFNLKDSSFEKITRYGNNTKSLWSNKFNGVFFISDRYGLYELFFHSFENKKTYCVTHTESGLFYPDLLFDENEIVFSLYTPNGYNIHTITIDHSQFEEVLTTKLRFGKLKFEEKDISPTIHQYNPLPSLPPRWWLPIPIIKEESISPGFITYSQDVLSQHVFSLYGAYFIPENKFLYDFTYTNNMIRPELSLEIMQDFTWTGNEWMVENEKNLYLSLSKRYMSSIHFLTTGYETQVLATTNEANRFSNIIFGYHFSNRLKFPKSIEYERGGYLTSTYRFYSEKLFGDYSFHNLKSKIGYYIKGPFPHNVISLKSSMGFSLSKTTNVGFMSLGGNNGIFSIRGYESGVYYGKTIFTGSLEYSLPFFWIERGIGTYPIYFRNIHAGLFSDIGTTAMEFPPDDFEPLLISFGMQTTLSLDLFYSQVPCDLTVGVAVTKDDSKPTFYFDITTSIPYLFNKETIIETGMYTHH